MVAVRAPFADAGIARLNRCNLCVVIAQIIDVTLTGQIPETSNKDQATMWREDYGVAGAEAEAMDWLCLRIEDSGLGWHVAIDNTKLSRAGRPRNVMYRAIFV